LFDSFTSTRSWLAGKDSNPHEQIRSREPVVPARPVASAMICSCMQLGRLLIPCRLISSGPVPHGRQARDQQDMV
jgi:hypothetical protein